MSKIFHYLPEELTVVTDEKHPLYDARVEKPVDEAMVASIMRSGVLEPIIIARDGDDFYVVDGKQRRINALEANRRLKKAGGELVKVPCVLKRGDDADLYEILVVTNELRTGDSPLERARKMQHLADLGRDETIIATSFGCTVATVKNHLALLECAAVVQRAVESGKVGATIATKLSKLAKDEQATLLEKMIAKGATKGAAADKAVKTKGDDVTPKANKVTAIDRKRVLAALTTVGKGNEVVRGMIAVFDFINGDLNAFKSWKDVAALVDDALNPTSKPKADKTKRLEAIKARAAEKTLALPAASA